MAWRISAREFRGMRGTDLASLGIPDEQAYLAKYLERTGLAPPSPREWSFYMAYNMFRIAAIFQGVMARALAGTAASAQALDTGRRARRWPSSAGGRSSRPAAA